MTHRENPLTLSASSFKSESNMSEQIVSIPALVEEAVILLCGHAGWATETSQNTKVIPVTPTDMSIAVRKAY